MAVGATTVTVPGATDGGVTAGVVGVGVAGIAVGAVTALGAVVGVGASAADKAIGAAPNNTPAIKHVYLSVTLRIKLLHENIFTYSVAKDWHQPKK